MGRPKFRLEDVDAGVGGSSEIVAMLSLYNNEKIMAEGSCSSVCRCVNYCPCECESDCGCDDYYPCSCDDECRCDDKCSSDHCTTWMGCD